MQHAMMTPGVIMYRIFVMAVANEASPASSLGYDGCAVSSFGGRTRLKK